MLLIKYVNEERLIIKVRNLDHCGPLKVYPSKYSYTQSKNKHRNITDYNLVVTGLREGGYINPLKSKRRLLCLKTQSVPHSKHFSSQL